jgi:hypothetical protein
LSRRRVFGNYWGSKGEMCLYSPIHKHPNEIWDAFFYLDA